MIETNRLILRECTLQDAPFIYKIMNSEGWLKNIGNRSINSVKDAEIYMQQNYLDSYKKYGFGSYVVRLKEDGTPIGTSGLYKRDRLDFPDIGFAYLEEYGNKGYAFEAANAIMKYAKETLKLQTITGITLPTNTASIKLLKKLGMSQVGWFTSDDGKKLLLLSN